MIEDTVSIAEAAKALGLSEWAVRRRVKSGKLPAIRVERPQGYEWRISLDQLALDGDPPPGVQSADDRDPALAALVAQLADERQRTAELEQERAELYGRLGYFQAQLEATRGQLQAAQARILELEAPKGRVPSDESNHPAHSLYTRDSAVQAVREQSEEQPQAEPVSEPSLRPATDGQNASSKRLLKRLWHWLTQPV